MRVSSLEEKDNIVNAKNKKEKEGERNYEWLIEYGRKRARFQGRKLARVYIVKLNQNFT